MENILIINAEKSYKWSYNPLIIPFIPAFKLTKKKLLSLKDTLNIKYIKSEEHGHCDILDPLWSDIMHKTIAKGVENREYNNLQLYYIWVTNEINNFLLEGENINNYVPCSYEYKSE